MPAITSIAALEAVIGTPSPAINLKVIDRIDPAARSWLEAAPLMFAGVGDGVGGTAITLAGGVPGFAQSDGPTLSIPLDHVDDPALLRPGEGFGSLFLLPGIGETLRINGRVAGVANSDARITVDECYVHCAKALIRSDFWKAEPREDAPDTIDAFVAACRFMALATINAAGAADLSPKGDPAGRLARIDDDVLSFPDRPGNRRTDSFRNIIAQPRIAAALLIPGTIMVATLTGSAALTSDEAARAPFAVQDRNPLLAARVEQLKIAIAPSATLARARLWPTLTAPHGISPSKMLNDHLRLNRSKGIGVRIASAIVTPGMIRKGLERDYKDNLY